MNRLKLTVLPSSRPDQDTDSSVMEREGFVDDAVVLALVAGPVQPRLLADPRELILPADDMDFAGWSLSSALPLRSIQGPTPFSELLDRQPALPTLDEPGIGAPHHGTHRWWLAGLAGALSTLLFSVLLLSLSNRGHLEIEGISIIPKPAAQPAPATPIARPATDAELTDVSVPK
jgi:hypothetical protein